MMMRNDGLLGFPGGYVDPGESVVEAMNRETLEEINAEVAIQEADRICCNSHQGRKGQYQLHLFAKQISVEKFEEIEQNVHKAHHFGSEVRT